MSMPSLRKACVGDQCKSFLQDHRSSELIQVYRISSGLPHKVKEDDHYEGMLIPKDATIFIPIWALNNSESQGFSDPETYNPDRYLNHPKLANDYAGSADYKARDESPITPFKGPSNANLLSTSLRLWYRKTNVSRYPSRRTQPMANRSKASLGIRIL